MVARRETQGKRLETQNELRRETVKALDAERGRVRGERARAAVQDLPEIADVTRSGCRRVKLCAGRRVPAGEWDEVVVLMPDDLSPDMPLPEGARVALPVYTAEPRFGALRNAVKRLLRRGVNKFEASDLATLHMLRQLGVEDVTADWTLYAFNASALAILSELGARRFVASPENSAANLRDLAESGYDVEFLAQQSTPLFISLTEPEPQSELATFVRGGLWVTTKRVPRTFDVPPGASARIDLSWDPQ